MSQNLRQTVLVQNSLLSYCDRAAEKNFYKYNHGESSKV